MGIKRIKLIDGKLKVIKTYKTFMEALEDVKGGYPANEFMIYPSIGGEFKRGKTIYGI